MLFSVAMTFSSFSPFRTSRMRSDLNLALKFLLVREMFLNPPCWCSKHIRFIKNRLKKCLILRSHYSEKYDDGIEKLRQTLFEQGVDPDDENIGAAFFDDASFADGTYNLPIESRWSTIITTLAQRLNIALDTALQRLEEGDPQLKGCVVEGTFIARNLAPNDIKKAMDEVNKIRHKTFGEEKDLIGRVYEYFLNE